MEKNFSHIDSSGNATLVDVTDKPDTLRTASAAGEVVLRPETVELIRQGLIKKGDVLTVAKIAGISAAKKTAELIPLCHNIPLSHIDVQLHLSEAFCGIEIFSTVRTTANTGVEMEALTAVSVSALTIYDMVKAVEKSARIQNIRVTSKSGGKSGEFKNP